VLPLARAIIRDFMDRHAFPRNLLIDLHDMMTVFSQYNSAISYNGITYAEDGFFVGI
jgi:hypothetical protein